MKISIALARKVNALARLSARCKKGKRLRAGQDPEDATEAEAEAQPVEAEAKEEQSESTAEAAIEESGIPSPPPAPPAPVPSAAAVAEEPPKEEEVAKEDPPAEPAVTTTATSAGNLTTRSSDTKSGNSSEKAVVPLQANSSFIRMNKGVSIMKDQLELAMEHLHLLTSVLIDKRTDAFHMEHLHNLTTKLRKIQRENTYIEGVHNFDLEDFSVSWHESEFGSEEDQEEVAEEHRVSSTKTTSTIEPEPIEQRIANEQYELDLHICYSPEKLLDQLLDLKREFCLMTNKVNEITAKLNEHDCLRTMQILNELVEQTREARSNIFNSKDSQERLEGKLGRLIQTVDDLSGVVETIRIEKVDKTELDILLADKVDYNQLMRKVSHEQLQQLLCRFEKQFCELHKILKQNDSKVARMLEDIRSILGIDNIDILFKEFKDKVDEDIRKLRDTLQHYIEATDDDCAAAGARIKVLQDLACISCDTTCVMRTKEKNKVGKLPNARPSNMISPLITYELGSIRKSGIMGYYRKDEFPHAPNAWLNRQNVGIKNCVPRHAGGPHTSHTAKEHVEKVLLNKK